MPRIALKRSPAPPPPSTIALVQSSSLPALVQKEIERMILAGDFAAGAKLNEAAVAAMLGVSRGPVREAFRALEESGLVRLEKNRGVFVRQISVEEADEIYEVRAAVDGKRRGLVDHWLHPIREVAHEHKDELAAYADDRERLNRLCELNVVRQVRNVASDVFVQEAWARGQPVSVHGWVYSLSSGLVTDLADESPGPFPHAPAESAPALPRKRYARGGLGQVIRADARSAAGWASR